MPREANWMESILDAFSDIGARVGRTANENLCVDGTTLKAAPTPQRFSETMLFPAISVLSSFFSRLWERVSEGGEVNEGDTIQEARLRCLSLRQLLMERLNRFCEYVLCGKVLYDCHGDGAGKDDMPILFPIHSWPIVQVDARRGMALSLQVIKEWRRSFNVMKDLLLRTPDSGGCPGTLSQGPGSESEGSFFERLVSSMPSKDHLRRADDPTQGSVTRTDRAEEAPSDDQCCAQVNWQQCSSVDVERWAFMVLRGICEDFPFSVWKKMLLIARLSFFVTINVEEQPREFQLTAETVLMRSVQLYMMGLMETTGPCSDRESGNADESDHFLACNIDRGPNFAAILSKAPSSTKSDIASEILEIQNSHVFSTAFASAINNLRKCQCADIPELMNLAEKRRESYLKTVVSLVFADTFWLSIYESYERFILHHNTYL